MGSAAAWWLARQGRDVVVLEQFEAVHRRGSSHGTSRIFRLAYPDRRYVAKARAALPRWRELEAACGVPLLRTVGGIDHGTERSVSAVAAALAAEGVAHSWLSADEAGERWPGFSFDGSVLFQPDGGATDADATVAALHRVAGDLGAELHFSTPVVSIDVSTSSSRVVVRTDGEEYIASVAVIAGGAWMPRLVTGLVPALPPITVTQEQVFHFARSGAGGGGAGGGGAGGGAGGGGGGGGGAGWTWPTFIHHREPFVYGLESPLDEGVKVAEHHAGAPVDPDTRDFQIDPAGRARVTDYVERWLPGLTPEPISATTCLYANTPTEDFVVERRGNLVIAAGFSGHGFKFTPLIGRQLATLATTPNPTPT
jgi:sarcosine oxidase